MNCEIDCETLTCKRCKKPIKGCHIKRNCLKQGESLTLPDNIDVLMKNSMKNSQPNYGPGTELKKLLSKIGIKAKSGCKCSDRARHIDYMESIEPGWTERNTENILDWMQEEAKKRKLPFIRAGAKVLVKLAIRRAKN